MSPVIRRGAALLWTHAGRFEYHSIEGLSISLSVDGCNMFMLHLYVRASQLYSLLRKGMIFYSHELVNLLSLKDIFVVQTIQVVLALPFTVYPRLLLGLLDTV